jgi:predicted transcriptional regulator
MRIVTIDVCSLEEVNRRVLAAFEGEEQGETISFATPALLFKVITSKRWDLLNTMTGASPLAIRELARRLGRDVKAVHADVHALLNAGVLSKDENGKVVFPYDAIHVDFMLKAA